MILSLLWKESRENRSRFLTVSAIMAVFFLAFFLINLNHADPYTLRPLLSALFFITCWILPTWMAASTVTSEKTQRTAWLLSSIPVQKWKIFLCKTAVTLFTFLIPTTLLLLYFATTPDPLAYPDQWLGMIIGMASLYIMITAFTTRLERESSAAAWGLLITLLVFLSIIMTQGIPNPSLKFCILALNPFSPLMGSLLLHHGEAFYDYSFHLAQIQMSAGMWLLGLWLYKVAAKPSRTSNTVDPLSTPPKSSTLPKRSFAPRSLIGALIWREFREQRGILLFAAVSGLLLAVIVTTLSSYFAGYSPADIKRVTFLRDFSRISLSLAFFIPAIVALILGIGAWATDLDTKVFDFWRSRPIGPAAVLWIKFLTALTGVFALMAMFALTSNLCLWLASTQLKSTSYADMAQAETLYLVSAFAFTSIISFSTLMMILLRKPILTVAMSMILFIVCIAAMTRFSSDFDNRMIHQTQIILLIANILALTLSHLALTCNWQLKPTTH